MLSVISANQNRGFKHSVIDPAKAKLDTKSQLIHFATFLWISSSFCVDILTKCMTVFINKVIILVHIHSAVRLTLGTFLVWKFNKSGIMFYLISSTVIIYQNLNLGKWTDVLFILFCFNCTQSCQLGIVLLWLFIAMVTNMQIFHKAWHNYNSNFFNFQY